MSRSSVGIFLNIPGPLQHSTSTLHARSHWHSCYSTHRGTPRNYFCSLSVGRAEYPGSMTMTSPAFRSYRALTAVALSMPCASRHHYATRSMSDTNAEEVENIWFIFMSCTCQSCQDRGSMRLLLSRASSLAWLCALLPLTSLWLTSLSRSRMRPPGSDRRGDEKPLRE